MTKSFRPYVYSFVVFTITFAAFIATLLVIGGCATTQSAQEALAAAPAKVEACDPNFLREFGAVRALPVAPGVGLIFNEKEEALSVNVPEALDFVDDVFKKNGYVSDKSFNPVVCSIEGQTVIIQK